MIRTPREFVFLAMSAALGATLAGQQSQAAPAYPDRDILTPFRSCGEISAPPEAQLATATVRSAGSATTFRAGKGKGCEVRASAQGRVRSQ